MSSPDYSSDDSSDRSYDYERHRRICPFQTPQFHDQECLRYFDCPTHTIERAGSDRPAPEHEGENEDEELENGDNNAEDDDANDDEAEDNPPLATSLGEARSAGRQMGEDTPEQGVNHEDPNQGHERQEVIDLTMSSPEQSQNAPDGDGFNDATRFPSSRALEVVDLTGDASSPSPPEAVLRARAEKAKQERTLPTIPTSGAGPSSSQPRPSATSPSAQRRPATPPSPPPPIRRRTSSNNFGTAPRAPQPQLQRPVQSRPVQIRRPSELVLPRWQPDAEVTICPICRTQFSFLVRKHHCRYVVFFWSQQGFWVVGTDLS